MKGKVKIPFCFSSATAKTFSKLPSAHPACPGGGQEQDCSSSRSRPPGEIRGTGLSIIVHSAAGSPCSHELNANGCCPHLQGKDERHQLCRTLLPALSSRAALQSVPLRAVPRVSSRCVSHRASQVLAQRLPALRPGFGLGSHLASPPATLQEKGVGILWGQRASSNSSSRGHQSSWRVATDSVALGATSSPERVKHPPKPPWGSRSGNHSEHT